MTTNPVVISEHATALQAAKIMQENHVGSLLVKKGKTLLGILTERDFVRKLAAKNLDSEKTKVKDIMTTDIDSLTPMMDISEAAKIMGDLNRRHMPVVEKDELVGMMTIKDLLKIQPQMIGLMYEKFNIRESDRKPVYQGDNEGICEFCGKYAQSLKQDHDGSMLCNDCNNAQE